MSRRRRRVKEKRKPFSPVSITSIVVGAGALVLFMIFIAFSVHTEGNNNNLMSAISVLCMGCAIWSLVRGVFECKNENFDRYTRWAGVIVSGLATACWFGIYLLGAIVG